jgi:secreted trypsin-like serine protease
VEQKIKKSLPQLFQDHLLCAGDKVRKGGACRGDSGGPLMYKDDITRKFVQIALVEGGVGECGDRDYPAIFVRLDHPSVWNFIASTINPLSGKEAQTVEVKHINIGNLKSCCDYHKIMHFIDIQCKLVNVITDNVIIRLM